jgi:hypothetical protein
VITITFDFFAFFFMVDGFFFCFLKGGMSTSGPESLEEVNDLCRKSQIVVEKEGKEREKRTSTFPFFLAAGLLVVREEEAAKEEDAAKKEEVVICRGRRPEPTTSRQSLRKKGGREKTHFRGEVTLRSRPFEVFFARIETGL